MKRKVSRRENIVLKAITHAKVIHEQFILIDNEDKKSSKLNKTNKKNGKSKTGYRKK